MAADDQNRKQNGHQKYGENRAPLIAGTPESNQISPAPVLLVVLACPPYRLKRRRVIDPSVSWAYSLVNFIRIRLHPWIILLNHSSSYDTFAPLFLLAPGIHGRKLFDMTPQNRRTFI